MMTSVRLGTEFANFAGFRASFTSLLLITLQVYDNMRDLMVAGGTVFDALVLWSYLILSSLLMLNILLSIVVEAFMDFKTRRTTEMFLTFGDTCVITYQTIIFDTKQRFRKLRFWKAENSDVEVAKPEGSMFEISSDQSPSNMTVHDKLKYMGSHCNSYFETYTLRSELQTMFSNKIAEKLISETRKLSVLKSDRDIGELITRQIVGNHKQSIEHSNVSNKEVLDRIEELRQLLVSRNDLKPENQMSREI